MNGRPFMTCYDLFIARQLTPSCFQSIQHHNLILGGGYVGWILEFGGIGGINFCRSRFGCLRTTRSGGRQNPFVCHSSNPSLWNPVRSFDTSHSQTYTPVYYICYFQLSHSYTPHSLSFNIITFCQKVICYLTETRTSWDMDTVRHMKVVAFVCLFV